MDKNQFFAALTANFEKGLLLMKGKNMDYCGEVDPFKNFRSAEMLNLSLEQGIMLRMSDKFARCANLLQTTAQVKDESIEDTLVDLMNYTNILLVYLQSKPKKEHVENTVK